MQGPQAHGCRHSLPSLNPAGSPSTALGYPVHYLLSEGGGGVCHFWTMSQPAIAPAKDLLATLKSASATPAQKTQAKKELKAAYPMMYRVWADNNR